MQREGQVRIPSGCAISGMFPNPRENMSGRAIVDSIAIMHDRSNGLGGGFAAYGIYPAYRDAYAFHLFYDDTAAQRACEDVLRAQFTVLYAEEIPTRKTRGVTGVPLIWRYFLQPDESAMHKLHMDERSYVAHCVMRIHADVPGAFVLFQRQGRRVFKGIGFPEDVANSTGWRSTAATALLRMAGTRPTRGLVGRRASVCPAGHHRGAQWRNLILRRQPPHGRDVRLQVCAFDGYRSHRVYDRLPRAPAGACRWKRRRASLRRRSGAPLRAWRNRRRAN